MPSVKEPLVLTRLSFSPGHANEERITCRKRAPFAGYQVTAVSTDFAFPLHSAQEAEFESVEGDVGAWVTVMGEVIT